MSRAQSHSWLNNLAPHIVEAIEEKAITKTYSAGSTVQEQGMKSDGPRIILQGRVSVSTITPQGRKLTLVMLGESQVFGDMNCIAEENHIFNFVAITDVKIRLIPEHHFSALRQQYPEINSVLIEHLSSQFGNFVRLYQRAITLPLESLLASRIHWLCQIVGSKTAADSGEIVLEVSQEELASLLFTSRQSINKVLKQWEAEELVRIEYGKIIVSDLQKIFKRAVSFS